MKKQIIAACFLLSIGRCAHGQDTETPVAPNGQEDFPVTIPRQAVSLLVIEWP
jgi:hypothetical protein